MATPEALKPRPPLLSPSGWERVKFVIVVVAKVEIPETLRALAEAFWNEDCPETVSKLEIVVEPVTVKVLEVGLKVKLLEPAVEDAAVA